MQSTSFRAITIFFLLSFAFACQKGERSRDASPQQSYHSWQYPVKLGDTRAKVHNLLGNAVRATSQLEEHPLSGVTRWFDADDPVTKLTFVGEAIVLYSPDPMDQIPSDRPVLRGLSPKMDDETFRRILGSPTKQAIERSKSFQELHCIWKDSGYVVDGLFLNVARTYESKNLAKGALIWFEVSHGL